MPSELKAKRSALLQEAIEQEPRIAVAKRFILELCLIFLATRTVFLIVETAYVLHQGLPITTCMPNFLSLVMGFLFVLGIYRQGMKELAYLAAAGGVLSVLVLLMNNFILSFQMGGMLYRAYATTLIIGALAQAISMLSISLNSDCKKYFSAIARINRALKPTAGQDSGGNGGGNSDERGHPCAPDIEPAVVKLVPDPPGPEERQLEVDLVYLRHKRERGRRHRGMPVVDGRPGDAEQLGLAPDGQGGPPPIISLRSQRPCARAHPIKNRSPSSAARSWR